MAYQNTHAAEYLACARRLNAYVRRTVRVDHQDPNLRGGVKGSMPVSGGYGTYEFVNWAAKFTIDANLLEQDIVANSA